MGYQVLARKWRPNRFGELVGQEHVVTAISNALDNDRLHHAYLFTGTRGVGKTTIARIFSKSLNCETGLSSKPCGQCSTCKEIENGNFIDLLEIDAASRTKVEDTRELLDNVQYKPSRGRYKVYLIDEVHMLSKHSFNALLKTLEEPPPHVKFLLATTDPQKLPVTILSRCLQFNLKALSRTQISQQLDFILGEEKIQFEKEALSQLARAAQGSMRDALSLTDQAIAQGNGVVGLQIVTDMLGLMDKNQVLKLVHAVVQKDSQEVMQQVEIMSEQAPDFALVLSEIMSLLHQIALTQFVPDACKLETISARAIFQLAKSIPAEQIQLLYQIALTGKKDLPHAADPRTGLEMTLLRMLAFCPNNLKLDALDIAAKTPDVAVVTQLSSSHSENLDTQTTLATEPVANVPDDSVNQNAPTVDVSQQENLAAAVKPESSLPAHEVVSIEPEQHQLQQPVESHSAPPVDDLQAPQQDLQAPQQDLITPQQDLNAPQQDLQAPQQDLQAPQQNLITPQQNLITPQQDLQAPQQDLITPQQDLNAPQQDLQAPQQDLITPQQDLNAPQQDLQAPQQDLIPPQQDLNAQQQDIMRQAEEYGHQPMDYDQYQPVSMEEQSSETFSGEYATSHFEDSTVQQQVPELVPQQQTDVKPNTSTADLIALRNRLKQSQRDQEEGAGQVKKSESSTPFNLASIRKQNQETNSKPVTEQLEKPSQAPETLTAPIPELPINTNTDQIVNVTPPWSVENDAQSAAEALPVSSPPSTSTVVSPFSAEKTIEEVETFDSSAHLDEENVGDVTLEISAFLPDKQKVLKALQVDDWSKLIEDMQVTALTKQLALHSAFKQQGNTVKLTLLETKSHLISETAQQQLKDALCLALNESIELEIELGQPINTPYALQIKVNQVRNEYAREVVKNDPGIQLLQQQFAAKVNEQSIQAR